ncbi:MAG: hypothetical protein Q7U42_01930, partial [Parvibaculum sp.]|nr:hypothetical protein [Parvibaculum sp.]
SACPPKTKIVTPAKAGAHWFPQQALRGSAFIKSVIPGFIPGTHWFFVSWRCGLDPGFRRDDNSFL